MGNDATGQLKKKSHKSAKYIATWALKIIALCFWFHLLAPKVVRMGTW